MASETGPSLLSIPRELRDTIYLYIFTPEAKDVQHYTERPDALAKALSLRYCDEPSVTDQCWPHHLQVLQTCKQIHDEAHVLAISLTGFHVSGESSHPSYFTSLTSHIRETKLNAIRNITLTARISHLRALNEAWAGLPFGNASLELDILTLVPRKPDASHTAYAEVADLSQSHTLAYIFAETLKRLRHVRIVEVKNHGCFNVLVWRLVYRSLVYRMWRWGGGSCGVRFQCCEENEKKGEEWFKVWLTDGDEGNEVGAEVMRLVGGSGHMPDPDLAGF